MPCSEVRKAFLCTSSLSLSWYFFFHGWWPPRMSFCSIRERTPNMPFLRCQADYIIHSPMSVLMVYLCTFSDELFQTLLISIYKAARTVLIWFICTQWIGTWKQQYISPLPPQVCSVIDEGRKAEQARQEQFFLYISLVPLLWPSLSHDSVAKDCCETIWSGFTVQVQSPALWSRQSLPKSHERSCSIHACHAMPLHRRCLLSGMDSSSELFKGFSKGRNSWKQDFGESPRCSDRC